MICMSRCTPTTARPRTTAGVLVLALCLSAVGAPAPLRFAKTLPTQTNRRSSLLLSAHQPVGGFRVHDARPLPGPAAVGAEEGREHRRLQRGEGGHAHRLGAARHHGRKGGQVHHRPGPRGSLLPARLRHVRCVDLALLLLEVVGVPVGAFLRITQFRAVNIVALLVPSHDVRCWVFQV